MRREIGVIVGRGMRVGRKWSEKRGMREWGEIVGRKELGEEIESGRRD